MLNTKTKNRQQLAKSVKLKPTPSTVFITQLPISDEVETVNYERLSVSQESLKRKSTQYAAASAMLQAKIRSTAVVQLNQERMQQFEDLRERQKKSYHRYLK